MGWRGTLAALLLLAISAGAYFWLDAPVTIPQEQLDRSADPEVTPLIALRPAEVQAVVLTLEGEARAATRGRGGTWIGSDRPELLDDLLVELGRLGALAEIDAEPSELDDFGFDPPLGVIQIRARAEILTIEVGTRNPSTTGVYLRFPSDNRVVLAGALVGWQFENAFRALTPEPAAAPKQ